MKFMKREFYSKVLIQKLRRSKQKREFSDFFRKTVKK